MPASIAKLEDLSVESTLDSSQLHNIRVELELVTIAITALSKVDPLEIGLIAQELQVESIVAEWLHEWHDSQSTPPQQLDIDQIRSIILIVHHLARQYQLVVRQNMNYWQQIVRSDRLPLESPALAEYISNFIKTYQTRFPAETRYSIEALSQAALNLLIELLFYGTANGHQRLWGALLQRSHSTATPPKPT
jgi:hypothetical protein